MKKLFFAAVSALLVLAAAAQRTADYDVIWSTPGENSGGSMPLGNGETGINVWVEKDGDLVFTISRTDALSEVNRLMKIGRVRVSLSPNPFAESKHFMQRLAFEEGVIYVEGGDAADRVRLKLFIDPDNDVIYTSLGSEKPVEITAVAESWRRSPHILDGRESNSAWTVRNNPDSVILKESADFYIAEKNAVAWAHKNDRSVYDLTMRHQRLEGLTENFPNPLDGRIFGGYITATGLNAINDSTLKTPKPIKDAVIKIATLSSQPSSQKQWLVDIKAESNRSDIKKSLSATQKWWKEFWERSYIFVDIPSDKDFGFKVTQSYIAQRFMAASSGRGMFPIKFNGSIFTTDPSLLGDNYSPDFRMWGNEFWWQNTRLPYYAMLSSADFDLMEPLFRFYTDRLDAMRTLAKKYYGAAGFFIPETISVLGTYSNSDYGWDRTGLSPDEVDSEWIRYIWVQSLELAKIILDYASYSGDDKFLKNTAIPVINEALAYFESRFVKDDKMEITPTQSLETYWYEVKNDMPSVAGLHYITSALLSLSPDITGEQNRAYWQKIAASLPALPSRDIASGKIFTPAETYLSKQTNVENPELYVVFPFGLANFASSDKDAAVRAYNFRSFDSGIGWGQDGQIAAMLGLTGDAVANLKRKVDNTNSKHRFIAMWGPNYDWVPDQDHGSNLLLTLQTMIIQSYGDKTYLLPSWPREWNVSFRLAAPNQTTVEGRYNDGKLIYDKKSGNQSVITTK